MKQITEGDILDAAINHVKEMHPDVAGDRGLQKLMQAKLVLAYMEACKWMQEQLQREIYELERLTQSDEKHIKNLEKSIKHYEQIVDPFIKERDAKPPQ